MNILHFFVHFLGIVTLFAVFIIVTVFLFGFISVIVDEVKRRNII